MQEEALEQLLAKVQQKEPVENYVEKKMQTIRSGTNSYGIGKVTSIKEFMIQAIGMDNVMFFEKVNIANKAIGYVVKIEQNYVNIALLKKEEELNIGDSVFQTNEEFQGSFSVDAIGRIIDIFGTDKLANKTFKDLEEIPIEEDTIPLMDRINVERPMQTGISGIDLIYPVGKGQRQLIIGDKKTGKTQICIDTITNQLGKNTICIYVAIGKTKKEVKEIYYELVRKNANSYTIMITAFNNDFPSILTLTPYYAMSVAKKYMQNGYDVLVVLDDLKRHAEAYREICLMSGKSPGRDAYPSDIFYLHSRLLEKGCQYKNGASITILPIVETKGGDITDYISTNIISITDGQIVLSTKNFQKGIKPAIDYGLSVSRLGGNVQTQELKTLGSKVRQKLLSYLETSEIYELANLNEMSQELQTKLFEGKKILDNLVQNKGTSLSEEEMKSKFAFMENKNV